MTPEEIKYENLITYSFMTISFKMGCSYVFCFNYLTYKLYSYVSLCNLFTKNYFYRCIDVQVDEFLDIFVVLFDLILGTKIVYYLSYVTCFYIRLFSCILNSKV